MDFASVNFDAYAFGLHAVDKVQVLQNVAWTIGRQTGADMTWLSQQFIANEDHENSAIDMGVAVIHLKSTPLKAPFLLLAKLSQAVDFNAADGERVDLVCAVLSPQMDGPHYMQKHLQRLSRATRLLRDTELLNDLRAAANEAEMRATIGNYKPRALAA